MSSPNEVLARVASELDLASKSPIQLLRSFAAVLDELRERNVVRTMNNPVADYTEWLVSTKLRLRLQSNSRSGFDAVGQDGTRYQIKGRRVEASTTSVQLSAIRNLDRRQFDFLIAVVYETDFTIRYAVRVPHAVVVEYSTYQAHTNSHLFHVRPSLVEDSRIHDLQPTLQA